MDLKNLLKIEIDSNRLFGLDIIKAIAIILVVIQHGNYIIPEETGHLINLYLFDGVSIFFVLSGFLIGGIIIKMLQKKI